MCTRNRWRLILLVLGVLFLLTPVTSTPSRAQTTDEVTLTLIGRVINAQDAAVDEAEVRVLVGGAQRTVTVAGKAMEVAYTGVDGSYIVELTLSHSLVESETLTVEVSKPGYRTARQGFTGHEMACTDDHCFVRIPDVLLLHVFNPAFFIATLTFVLVFALITFHVLHQTLAALLGATVMLSLSYTLGTFNPSFWILDFGRAVEFIDFDVIFLIMTLMIVVSITGRTGVFQWLALAAYRAAGGSAWRLAVILIGATAVMSAFLNNVTIMLLMAPVTIEIALMLGIKPAALIIPEAMASNIGGAATLIGDPPNTLIGSFADLGFNQFLLHMGPIALIATLVLIGVVHILYRREYAAVRRAPSPALLARLEKDAQITDPATLKRALLVVGGMMVLFLTGDLFRMPPSVVGLIGATVLLAWVRPDMEEMLREVDWMTLVFFMSLFIVVGGVQEVGLIHRIADFIADAAGTDLFLASQTVIWLSAVVSPIVDNIPFTTAALPIAAFLTRTIPGADNNVLYWSLSLGANLGGNATYVGAAPNVVAIGVLGRAGYPVTFVDWLKVGIPVAVATVLVPAIWMWIRYFWLRF